MSWHNEGKRGRYTQLTRRIPIGTQGHYLIQELLVEDHQVQQFVGRKWRKKRKR